MDCPPEEETVRCGLSMVRAAGEAAAGTIVYEREHNGPFRSLVDLFRGMPRALVKRAIENSSRPGDTVLDPFLGSGTPLIACGRSGWVCRGTEVDPRSTLVAVQRWETPTSGRAAKEPRGRRPYTSTVPSRPIVAAGPKRIAAKASGGKTARKVPKRTAKARKR